MPGADVIRVYESSPPSRLVLTRRNRPSGVTNLGRGSPCFSVVVARVVMVVNVLLLDRNRLIVDVAARAVSTGSMIQ